jgi:Uma2 family endonuclease
MYYNEAMLDAQSVVPERIRPLLRSEYDHLIELGAFADERIELLYGTLVEMSPQGISHSSIVQFLSTWLMEQLSKRVSIRIQSPLAATNDSEPEPDIAVVPKSDYRDALPSQALWIIEVADSSMKKDSVVKARLYATMNVPEYWIVDIKKQVLEIRSMPIAGEYTVCQSHGKAEAVCSLSFPDLSLSLDELFR